jgi:hypothetical protein
MARISCPSNAIQQAGAVLEAWKDIDAQLKFGEVTIAALEAELEQVRAELSRIAALEAQLIDLRNRRDALTVSVWDKVTRVRLGVKGFYGDDSSEYEMVGGTRRSEYKHSKRKKAGA